MKKKSSRYIQLDFFSYPKTEYTTLWDAIENLRSSHHSVRKRMFKEINEIKSIMHEITLRQNVLAFKMNELNQYDMIEEMKRAQ